MGSAWKGKVVSHPDAELSMSTGDDRWQKLKLPSVVLSPAGCQQTQPNKPAFNLE